MSRVRFLAFSLVLSILASASAQARVVKIQISSRSLILGGKRFGTVGPYEKLQGKVYFAIHPSHPLNRQLTDIDLAPVNSKGEVEFSADLYMIKPVDIRRCNGAILYEVVNRGRKLMLGNFNGARNTYDPEGEADFGDGFLMRLGYTLVWAGWQFDVPHIAGLMRSYVPVITDKGKTITGLVRSDFVVGSKVYVHSLADRGHIPYLVSDPKDPDNVLTVRDSILARRQTIPRHQWDFAVLVEGKPVPDPGHVYLSTGFEPGKIYEVVYKAKDPVLVGASLVIPRDLISFLKYETKDSAGNPNPLAVPEPAIDRALAFGSSQSGRYLRTFLYQGFNEDESHRRVFDGMLINVAGAGRGSFNHRFAQPSRDAHPHSRFLYPTDIFPFTDQVQTDPETGISDGLLKRATEAGVLPKIFYTNSAYEYWGRAASLIHTTVDGKADVRPPDNVRIYAFASTQHGPASFPPTINTNDEEYGQQRPNPIDFRPALRALLVALDEWVKDGIEPPPSRYPNLADGTLVPPDPKSVGFPNIPGVEFPRYIHEAYRVDYGPNWAKGIISYEPPQVGKAFPVLVPKVDADGNDLGGIRMPEVEVPLATCTGWNLRHPDIGAPGQLVSMVGSYIPFPRTRAEREKKGDPRLSIEERYRDKAHYLGLISEAALKLIRQRYLLAQDLPSILWRAAAHYEHATRP